MAAKVNIKFNRKNQASTSGWYNNCGINCLAHFIAAELVSKTFDAHKDSPETKLFLACFDEFYHCEGFGTPDNLRKLLKKYPHPKDREKILSPVLRIYLKKILLQETAESSWRALPKKKGGENFTVDELVEHGNIEPQFRDFLNSPTDETNEASIKANLTAIQELKREYEKAKQKLAIATISAEERTAAEKILLNNTYVEQPAILAILNNHENALDLYIKENIITARIKQKKNELGYKDDDMTDLQFHQMVKEGGKKYKEIKDFIEADPKPEEIAKQKDLLLKKPGNYFARILKAKDAKQEIAKIREELIKNKVILMREDKLLEEHLAKAKDIWVNGIWVNKDQQDEQSGHDRYAERMGDISYAEMMTEREILCICRNLGINAKIYPRAQLETPTYDLAIAFDKGKPVREIKFINLGLHWEFELANDTALKTHNNQFGNNKNKQFEDNAKADEVQTHIMRAIKKLKPSMIIFTPMMDDKTRMLIKALQSFSLEFNAENFESLYRKERGKWKKLTRQPGSRRDNISTMNAVLEDLQCEPSLENCKRVKDEADKIIASIKKENPRWSSAMRKLCEKISERAGAIIDAEAAFLKKPTPHQ